MYFDAHNHVHFPILQKRWGKLLLRLEAIGLAGAVVNGTHPDDDWDDVAALAARHPWVVPSFGVHPWDVGTRPADWQAKFEARLMATPRAAVGEIGIDRWMIDTARPDHPLLTDVVRAPMTEQIEVFVWQLDWAAKHDRPVTIHCLQAWGQLLEILQNHPRPTRGFLLHAYGGPTEMVPAFTELGAYFSFNTSFLDPRKKKAQQAFAAVPADRLLAETDAPATPAPHPRYQIVASDSADVRRANHPANITQAYDALAALRGVGLLQLQRQIAENFGRLFVRT